MEKNKEYEAEEKVDKESKKADSEKESKDKETAKDDDKDENLAPPPESVAAVQTGKDTETQ